MENDFIARYYSNHVDEIRTFFMVRLSDKALCEDMTQDVFVKILGCGQIITEKTLPSLVYTIARRSLTDYYRHLQAVKRHQCTLSAASYEERDSPHSLCEAHELANIVEQGMASLPAQCREVYRMDIYDSLKVSRIAEVVHLSYKATEYCLGMARRKMRLYVKNAF